MSSEALLAFGGSFTAGVLASLSPCVYPMIPISLSYLSRESNGRPKTAVLLFFMGQVLTLTALGLAAARLGEVFGFSSELRWVNLVSGLLLLGLGFLSWKGDRLEFLGQINQKLQKTLPTNGLLGAVTFGAISALVASPCTSPALGAVLVSLAQSPGSIWAASQMFFFALGLGLIFLVLGLGFKGLLKTPRAGAWMKKVHSIMTSAVFGAAIYYLFRSL